MSEERKLYEDWLHKSPEFGETIISAWDVWQARAALSAPAESTVVEPVASLMTNIQSGDVKLVWNDEAFDRTLWHETPLYVTPPRAALSDAELRKCGGTAQ